MSILYFLYYVDNIKYNILKLVGVEDFDSPTFGLWAQHSSSELHPLGFYIESKEMYFLFFASSVI